MSVPFKRIKTRSSSTYTGFVNRDDYDYRTTASEDRTVGEKLLDESVERSHCTLI
jgi:hypothetical protein